MLKARPALNLWPWAKRANQFRRRNPFAAGDEESARGRLLSAATHLFCKNGINATGIDAIIDEAGTAKTTLYKLFGSKTNLVHAVLESEGKQWREWFIGAIEEGGGDAETKLTRIFPALKSWFGEERFYGCPFINAVGEHDKDTETVPRHRNEAQEGRAGAYREARRGNGRDRARKCWHINWRC